MDSYFYLKRKSLWLLQWAVVTVLSLSQISDQDFSRTVESTVSSIRPLQISSSSSSGGWNNISSGTYETNEAYRKSAETMQLFSEIYSDLNESSKHIFDQLNPLERQSVQSAMTVVQTRYMQAVAKNQELEKKKTILTHRLALLRSELIEMQNRNEALLDEIVGIQLDITSIENSITFYQQKSATYAQSIQMIESDLLDQKSLMRRAQESYWTEVGRIFEKLDLGSPRDYVLPVAPDVSSTQIRTIYYKSGTVAVANPQLPIVAEGSGVVAIAREPLNLAPLNPPVESAGESSKEQFISLLGRCAKASQQTASLQDRCDYLTNQFDSKSLDLKRKSIESAENAREKGMYEAMKRNSKEILTIAKLTYDNNKENLKRLVKDSYEVVKERCYWELMKAVFDDIRTRQSNLPDIEPVPKTVSKRLAIHFTWVMKGYNRFLAEDLPQVPGVLGTSSFPEAASEPYNRFLHLTEGNVSDWSLRVWKFDLTE